MKLSSKQRLTGMKYNMMMTLMSDILNKRYNELQQLYESLHLRTNEKLLEKLDQKRNISVNFTNIVYLDALLVIADYFDDRTELIELFETLYTKRFPNISKLFYEWERQYDSSGSISGTKKKTMKMEESFFLKFLFYKSEIFVEPDKIIKDFDFERDQYLLYYSFYLTDNKVLSDGLIFHTNQQEIEEKLNNSIIDDSEKIIESTFFKKYLIKRRNELAEYLQVKENKLAEYIHSEMKSHSVDGTAPLRTGIVGLIENCAKNIITDHNGGTSWYNNMTTVENSKEFDIGLRYVPDVDKIIENYFKSYVTVRYAEEASKKKGFTKLTLSRECIPVNYESVHQTILCMYEMDVLYKMFSIMQRQYYRDFSWEKITNQSLATRYEEMIANLDQIIKEKENRINVLSQKNHVLSLQLLGDNSKQTAPLVVENNKLLKIIEEKNSTISDLKKQLQYQEEFIAELNKPNIEQVNQNYDMNLLQAKRFLFVGHISEVLPELKREFPNSLFMETETLNLSGIEVDAVIMLIRWMSHSMFYKIKSAGNLYQTKIVMCNTKNINSILQKMYDEVIV